MKIQATWQKVIKKDDDTGVVFESGEWVYALPKGYLFSKTPKEGSEKPSVPILGGDEAIGYATQPSYWVMLGYIFSSFEEMENHPDFPQYFEIAFSHNQAKQIAAFQCEEGYGD